MLATRLRARRSYGRAGSDAYDSAVEARAVLWRERSSPPQLNRTVHMAVSSPR